MLYQKNLDIKISEDKIGQFEIYLAVDAKKEGIELEKTIYDDRINGIEGRAKRAMLRETIVSRNGCVAFLRIKQNERVADRMSDVPCEFYIFSSDERLAAELENKFGEILHNGVKH